MSLYLSYHYESEELVDLFYHKLKNEFNFKVNYSKKKDESNLNDPTDQSINESKCFLCFLNKSYIETDECKYEIKYAAKQRKKIFVLRIENIKINDLNNDNELLAISPFATLNFYNRIENQISRDAFDFLIKSINDSFKTEMSIKQNGNWQVQQYTNGRYEGELFNVV